MTTTTPPPSPARTHSVPVSARPAPRQHADDALRSDAGPGALRRLRSRPEGLTGEEAAARLASEGPNALVQMPGPSVVKRFMANLTHFMALLLWAGAAVAVVAGLPQLAVAITLVNVVNGVFSFWQEHRADRATEALRRLLPSYSRVIRDGRELLVPAEDLVVGDILLLGEGDRISADARLLDSVELRVDQSTLTGESRPARKSSQVTVSPDTPWAASPNLVFAGTSVSSGRATAVVYATAMATEFGRIAELTEGTARDDSPLQQELRRLSMTVALIAIGVGVAFFALAQALTPMGAATGFIFTLGMIVAFVPEGLLPTVTLALAMGTQRMARRNALVKRLAAVETLGCTTVICTDKTGTLTKNEMTVRVAWTCAGEYRFEGTGYDPAGAVVTDSGVEVTGDTDLRDLLISSGLANNSRVVPPQTPAERWTVLGDPTEAALKVAAAKAGLDLESELLHAPRVRELPFNSVRKRMTTVHKTDDGVVAHVKGAPRELLERCTRVRVGGHDRPLDPAVRAAVEAAHDAYSRGALRVLAVATRRLAGEPTMAVEDADDVEQDLTLLGLVAMLDPPHPEVAEAVERCSRAGIRILMMTGDYGLTAESVARRIGLVDDAGVRVINGNELDHMDDGALAHALDSAVIFARATPEQKLRVVTALQAAGHVVAVTGDGVNDAPALKRADIGVAMGKAGTDVAKEAADMVLLDDNFASIVNAVEEGRSVYTNIRKFTGYIFTSNTPEAVPFMVFAFSGGRIPLALGVMHILAVDLGTDLVPALALGAEPPEPGVMERPPRRRDEHLVNRRMLLRSYGWLGPLQSLAVMGAFFYAYWAAGYDSWLDLPDSGPSYRSATAVALAAVVLTQVGNLYAHRTEHQSILKVGWTTNRLAFVGIATELLLIAAIVYVPVLQRVVGTAAFPRGHWLLLFAAAPLLLLADEARKAVVRRRIPGNRRSP